MIGTDITFTDLKGDTQKGKVIDVVGSGPIESGGRMVRVISSVAVKTDDGEILIVGVDMGTGDYRQK